MASQAHSPNKRLKGPERRQQIINSTIELASRKGSRSVRTKEIANEAGVNEAGVNEAGVNEALIFRHIDNKEALLQAVVHEATGKLFAQSVRRSLRAES